MKWINNSHQSFRKDPNETEGILWFIISSVINSLELLVSSSVYEPYTYFPDEFKKS